MNMLSHSSPLLSTRAIVSKTFDTSLEDAIRAASLVSFDIFDTLLRRPYLRPEHLFDDLGQLLGVEDFPRQRRAAEARARKTHSDKRDVSLTDIYAQLDMGAAHEVFLEENVVYPRRDILPWLRYAKAFNKPVAAVSDMYLPKEVIARMLDRHGIHVDHLIVSAADNVAKSDGTAFELLARQAQVPLQDMLHIGDNKGADYEAPASLGMQAMLIGNTVIPESRGEPVEDLLAALQVSSRRASQVGSVIRDILCTHGTSTFWRDIGRYHAAPLAFGYAQWVKEQFDTSGWEHAAFVARDGYLPLQAFRRLSPATPASYLHLTRSIILRAGLENLTPLILKHLCYGSRAPVSSFITRLGPGTEVLLAAASGHFGGDPVVGTDIEKDELADFFRSRAHLLADIGRDSRTLLVQYLAQQKMLDRPDKVAVIDVGWNGTAASLLKDIVPESKFWNWLYVGTHPTYPRDLQNHRSMYFTRGEPAQHHALMNDSIEIFEFLFTSPKPTAVALEGRHREIQPLYAPADSEWAGRRERIDAIEEGVREALPHFHRSALRDGTRVGPDSYTAILKSIIQTTHPSVISEFAAIEHQIGIGAALFHPLLPAINPRHYWSNILRIIKGKRLKAESGVVYWATRQDEHFLKQLTGPKKYLARMLIALKGKRRFR